VRHKNNFPPDGVWLGCQQNEHIKVGEENMTKVAVVTGGSRGIGAAISIALRDAGYAVAANYGGNDEAAAAFSAETGIATYKFDVGDYEACAAAMAKIEADLGPVDVLVNNAGITKDGFFHKMSPEQWRSVINVDLDSLFNCTRPVINGMRERGYGRIINISSINGQKGQVGQVNYSAAKAGVIGFTKALAQEGAAKGVTVNCVAPGYIATEMVSAMHPDALAKVKAGIPCGRVGESEEIARAVLFLVEDPGFINGSTLTINGAQYIAG
jgi:acetoacetyl-CoA reductase